MVIFEPAYPADAGQCMLVSQVTSQRIGGIRRIDHHATRTDNIRGLVDQARLRIFRMNAEELAHRAILPESVALEAVRLSVTSGWPRLAARGD